MRAGSAPPHPRRRTDAHPSVARLLTRAFGVLVALIVACGVAELTVVLVQRHTVTRLTDEVQPVRLANARLRAVLTDAQRGLRGYLLTGDGQLLDTYHVARSDYVLATRQLRDLADDLGDPVDRQVLRADAWWRLAERQRLAAPRSRDAAAYAAQGAPLFQAFVAANHELEVTLAAREARLHRRGTVLQWITVGVVGVLTAGSGAIALVTGVRTRRRITGPLGAVVEVLDRRRAGDREVRVDTQAGPVEIRAVAEAVNAAADQAELIRRKEEEVTARLQALDAVKTDFMSTVSHELRTPLTSISGYLELLRDEETGRLTDAQLRMLEVIGRNTRRLRELIEDMLTLSKIESGEFRSRLVPGDLAEVIERALGAVGPAAAKASVGLHSDVRGPLPVCCDRAHLDRMMADLLGNAVKFTPADGTVTVRAERAGGDVVLVVADTGIGIPADEQQALFVRFFRATNAIRQAVPGTGLGLAIVATIVRNHGGSIEIESTENAGTTVTVRLPAEC